MSRLGSLFVTLVLISILSAYGSGARLSNETPLLEIRNLPVRVQNNAGRTYDFGLSVLGLLEENSFFPFLAIAIDYTSGSTNQWMAIWNLNSSRPGLVSQFKALIPGFWGTASGDSDEVSVLDTLPRPYLTWNSKRGSWAEFKWTTTKVTNTLVGALSPFRFLLKNYVHYRDDIAERRFYQTYTLVRLYDEVSSVSPSSRNLSAAALTSLKYHLFLNQSSFGLFVEREDSESVVHRFESSLRETEAAASWYAHGEANQRYLRYEEIPYGFVGRPPLGRAGILSISGSDLPDELPDWPANNLFDLAYSPYSHPRVRQLMDMDPADRVPLGIYVLGSELRIKPVLVVDFFDPSNPKRRKATGTLKVALDHFLSVRGIPLLGQILKRTAEYALDKKDVTYFNEFSSAIGSEATRLYARMGWNLDPDLNHLLIQSVEGQIANPLVESSTRERSNLQMNFQGLLLDDGEHLGLMLRKLLEDKIRKVLDLNGKAIFKEDLAKFERYKEYSRSLKTIREFNMQPHLPTLSWERIVTAWTYLERADFSEHQPEMKVFVKKVSELFPDRIPYNQRAAVRTLLGRDHVAKAGSVVTVRAGDD